jgi:hypothetical protein
MKKFSLVLAMLAFVLVFGLAFVGCGGGVKDAPELTEVYTALRSGTSPDYSFTAATSFTTSQAVSFVFGFLAPYQDIARIQYVVKKDGEIWYAYQSVFTPPKGDNVRYSNWTPFASYPAGSYTAELYLVDIDGKKSNTLSTNFTVTP